MLSLSSGETPSSAGPFRDPSAGVPVGHFVSVTRPLFGTFGSIYAFKLANSKKRLDHPCIFVPFQPSLTRYSAFTTLPSIVEGVFGVTQLLVS